MPAVFIPSLSPWSDCDCRRSGTPIANDCDVTRTSTVDASAHKSDANVI